jgi:hypothetical protein
VTFCPIVRDRKSLADPGENGTIMRIGFTGNRASASAPSAITGVIKLDSIASAPTQPAAPAA